MGTSAARGQTLLEKITQRYAAGPGAGHIVRANDFVSVRPKHVMTHDNTGAVIPKFESMFEGAAPRVFDPSQPVIAIDHDIQNRSPENLEKYGKIEAFAKKHGLAFFPAGTGIAHQIVLEECFAIPGAFVVGSDSHSNIYGAVAAAGTPVVRTDAAAIWATGRTWWQVPETVRVTLTGRLRAGASGKDVIIALCGFFGSDEVLNCAVEFAGPGVAALTIDQRMTIANMTTEWGALTGIFPYDEVTRAYLLSRARRFRERGDREPRLTPEILERIEPGFPAADPDALYAKEATFDLGSVVPHVAGPNEVKIITPLPEIEKKRIAIHKAYLLSCVNGRLEDIVEAARVLRGRKVASGVKMYLAAASAEIEGEARRLGAWDDLLKAGAIALPPGCGPCIGLGEGILEEGEVCISATNRNFKGRMGHASAQAYLAGPAVVAASAAAGHIAAPEPCEALRIAGEIRTQAAPAPTGGVTILPGFPGEVRGVLIFCDKDDMNTDGIYGKDFTYVDNMPPAEMGAKAMLNYDPKFQEIAREGDILASGWNFGAGSSREQAATALKHRGIRMVIAGSYSQTYKRNAFNNGYVVIECPMLVAMLRERFGGAGRQPTVRTGIEAVVDFSRSEIRADGRTFPFFPLGEVAQRLVIAGGFEAMLRDEIRGRA